MQRLILLLILYSFSFFGKTQDYQFKYFDRNKGIEEPYIYAIDQDENGLLWLATSGGVKIYDGYHFETLDMVSKEKDNFIKSLGIIKKTKLIGSNVGNLYFVFEDGSQKKLNTSGNSAPINQIIKSDTGYLALSQNGELYAIDLKGNLCQYQLKTNQIYRTLVIHKGLLYFGTNKGIFEYTFKDKDLHYSSTLITFQEEDIDILKSINETLFVGTVSNGLYSYKNNLKATVSLGNDLHKEHIKDIIEHYGTLYVSTFGNGVFKLNSNPSPLKKDQNLEPYSNLNSSYINTLFIDKENTFWLGSYGDGLIRLHNQEFVTYDYETTITHKEISSLYINNNCKYLGVEGGLFVLSKKGTDVLIDVKEYGEKHGLPNDKVTCILETKFNDVYVGTKQNGIFVKKSTANQFKAVFLGEDRLSKKINQLSFIDNIIYVSTASGLFLMQQDGTLLIKYSTENGLPYNNIKGVQKTSYGIVVLTSCSSIPVLSNKSFKYIKVPSDIGITDFTGVTEVNNQLYFSSLGKGIVVYNNNNKSFHLITSQDGLKSEFCYGIKKDILNKIWITHRGGISSYVPSLNQTRSYNENSFIDKTFEPNIISEDNQQNLWFGSNIGAIKYTPYLDNIQDNKPSLILDKISVNDSVRKSADLFEDYGKKKVHFYIKGISIRNPNDVYFQYKLVGYDEDWSSSTKQNSIQYNQLYDGKYTLYVRAKIFNKGSWTSPQKIASIKINKPFWKYSGFYIALFILLIVGTFLIINWRTAQFKKQNELLEEKLQNRTKEIIAQRNELALQNKDISDSIAYAQRIQNSILSDPKLLKDNFADSFVYLQPKDIVSGDFYWFEKRKRNFLLACADATGHGVPGAFMSIIGSSVIKEIASDTEVTSPDQFLTKLDSSVDKLLGQKGKEGDGRDGMDISFLQINLDTLFLRCSSALRPIYIIRKSNLMEIKPDRFPVGGGFLYENKKFTLNEFQLEKGDIIYQFSDGYADQFGGSKGKKMRVKPFKKLLLEIHNDPLMLQKEKLLDFLNAWKGDLEQVDDILIIGIKV